VSGSGANEYESADVMLAMSVEELLDSIIDSGGSYHMTYKRDYLFDFEEYNGGNILLSDGRECRSGLSKVFWADDTTMSTYLVNSSPSMAIGFKTPIDMLESFGYLASIKQGMLEPVKVKRIFVEYREGMMGYKLWRLDDVTSKGVLYINMGVEFEVEPHKDHAFEVEPHGNVDHVVGFTRSTRLRFDRLSFSIDKEHTQHENNLVACEEISQLEGYIQKEDMGCSVIVYVLIQRFVEKAVTTDMTITRNIPLRLRSGLLLSSTMSKFVHDFGWRDNSILSLEEIYERTVMREKIPLSEQLTNQFLDPSPLASPSMLLLLASYKPFSHPLNIDQPCTRVCGSYGKSAYIEKAFLNGKVGDHNSNIS
ncbi:hypothetical protein Tco_1171322, partial [Tanacetum coccineum]